MTHPAEPPSDCDQCPRLVAYRTQNRKTYPDWHNGAVASFGNRNARLLIVGLAPGLRGANRTARPFTGDAAGDVLYAQLSRTKFARGEYSPSGKDNFRLHDCMITNAVRCVPPDNKPTAFEINRCRAYLRAQLVAMPHLSAILSLGKIAHDSVMRAYGMRLGDYPFKHGAHYTHNRINFIASYHCSRYNINTRRLTDVMFSEIFDHLRILIAAVP